MGAIALVAVLLGAGVFCAGMSATYKVTGVGGVVVEHGAPLAVVQHEIAVPDGIEEVARAVSLGYDQIECEGLDGEAAMELWHTTAMLKPAETFDVGYGAEKVAYVSDKWATIYLVRDTADKQRYDDAVDLLVHRGDDADCDLHLVQNIASELFRNGEYSAEDYAADSSPAGAVLRHKANCMGWARACADALQRVGLAAVAATAESSSHAVCAVAINGDVWLVDGTAYISGMEWMAPVRECEVMLDDENAVRCQLKLL